MPRGIHLKWYSSQGGFILRDFILFYPMTLIPLGIDPRGFNLSYIHPTGHSFQGAFILVFLIRLWFIQGALIPLLFIPGDEYWITLDLMGHWSQGGIDPTRHWFNWVLSTRGIYPPRAQCLEGYSPHGMNNHWYHGALVSLGFEP